MELIGRAAVLRPADAEVWRELGIVEAARGRGDEAIAAFREVLRLAPDFALAWNDLGNALLAHGQIAGAIAAYRQAVRVEPDAAIVLDNLGVALAAGGKLEDSAAIHRRSILLAPESARSHFNLGDVLAAMKRWDEAIAAFREAARLSPTHSETRHKLGLALFGSGKLDEAASRYREAISLKPSHATAWSNLAACLHHRRQHDAALQCFRQALSIRPAAADIHSNYIHCLSFHPDASAQAIAAETRRWDEQHACAIESRPRAYRNDPDPDRPIRIGYVSPDFRNHVVGHNLLPLLREHDRGRFTVCCYSATGGADAVTAQIRALAAEWREIADLTDEQAAERIQSDGIDILVDLAMHTAGNRLPLFTRKPAPVQATYLAYCGTTGLAAMDYRLSDPFLDPPGTDLTCYREETIRLPRSYWCYEPLGPTPAVSPLPAREAGYVVFGCLNYFAKISDRALELWLEILRAVPDSRLRLLAPTGAGRERIAARLTECTLAPERLEFADAGSWSDYLENWRQIDVGLDPFPYGGGITTCDALWMGVPVISLSGQTAVGRGGRSILSNVDLPELIADSPEDYVQMAAALAGDLPRLNGLRSGLRERMEHSPLRDARGFAREIESAYREMWSRWCMKQGHTP